MHFLWNISFSKLQFSPNCFIFISAKEIWERKWLATFVFFKWYKGLIYIEKVNKKESRFVYFRNSNMYFIFQFEHVNFNMYGTVALTPNAWYLVSDNFSAKVIKQTKKIFIYDVWKALFFVVNETSRTMEAQWQNWKAFTTPIKGNGAPKMFTF